MMDMLRRHATGWVAKILIAMLAMSFAIWGVHDVFRTGTGDNLATIGNEKITRAEFQSRFEQQVRNLSRQTGQNITPEQARQAGIDRQVLGELIRDSALTEEAKELGLAMPADVVAGEIAANPAFQNAQGQFDPAAFRRLLERNGINEHAFLANETGNRLRQLLADAVSARIRVPDTLVEAAFREMNETRTARWFAITADEGKLAAATDEDLKKFYDDNQQLFTAPAYRSVAVMAAEPADLAASITVTADEVAAAYERRKSEYGTPERRVIQQLTFPTVEEAQKARDKMKKPADFLSLAKERNITEKDATLGDLTKDAIPDPALADAAFSLKEGEVSQPVKGRLAVVLVRAAKVTPGAEKTLDVVRADVEAKLKLDKAKDEILAIHDKVEDARAGGANFDEIARDLKLKLEVLPAVDAQGLGKDGKPVTIQPPVLQAAYESDVGVENDPVPTPTDGFAWYEVREVTPAAVRPLAEVKDQVAAEWKKRELRKQVLDAARALSERAAKGESFEALASGQKIETADKLSRTGKSDAFDPLALSALFSTPEKGVGFAPRADGASAIIFEAGPLTAPAFDAKSDEAKKIRDAIARGQANDSFAMYLANLQARIGVDINNAAWAQLSGAGGGS